MLCFCLDIYHNLGQLFSENICNYNNQPTSKKLTVKKKHFVIDLFAAQFTIVVQIGHMKMASPKCNIIAWILMLIFHVLLILNCHIP